MKNKRILVMEDEFLVASLITSVLEKAGFGEVQQTEMENDSFELTQNESWDGWW